MRAPSAETLFKKSVLLVVMACPMPLCGLSGATTITFPISAATEINVRMPGAFMPSSLVTKIVGLEVILEYFARFSSGLLVAKLTIFKVFYRFNFITLTIPEVANQYNLHFGVKNNMFKMRGVVFYLI
jgi:hypothetical protein